jgi:hypothetical protein
MLRLQRVACAVESARCHGLARAAFPHGDELLDRVRQVQLEVFSTCCGSFQKKQKN